MNLAISSGRNDCYSEVKLRKLKAKHPELTYKTYKLFRDYGVQFNEISKMYGIPKTRLREFVNEHEAVLKKGGFQ